MPTFVTGISRDNSLCIYPHKHAKIPHLLSFEIEKDIESLPDDDLKDENYDINFKGVDSLANSIDSLQRNNNNSLLKNNSFIREIPDSPSHQALFSLQNQNSFTKQTQSKEFHQSSHSQTVDSFHDSVVALKLVAGKNHGFIVTVDDELYGFGANPISLGLNPESIDASSWSTRSSPFNLREEAQDFFESVQIKDIACGEDFTFILTQNNELFCFGVNTHGNLGLSHTVDVHIPTKNTHPAFLAESSTHKSRTITHISCGNHHTCIVLDYVDVICFGRNKEFQCGISNGLSDSFSSSAFDISEPRHVLSFISPEDATSPSNEQVFDHFEKNSHNSKRASDFHSEHHSLRSNKNDEMKEKILYIASGKEHNIVVTENNEIWTWGSNQFGQCGVGHKKPIISPHKILFPLDSLIKLVGCGEYFTVFVTESNEIYITGRFMNQLYLSPTPLHYNGDQYPVDQLSVGDTFFIFTSNSNTHLWVCGENDAYQLGTGSQLGEENPIILDHDFLSLSAYSHIACGGRFSIFSTFTKKFELKCYEDLKDQLLLQSRRRSGYLYDLELIVNGHHFFVSRDLVEKRFPLSLQLDRTNDVLSAEAFSLCIDYIYSDDIYIPQTIENPELILLELYAYIISNKYNKKNQISPKLESTLLARLIQVISETTVVNILRKLDDFIRPSLNGFPNTRSNSSTDTLSEAALNDLLELRQHMIAYLKYLMDENRLNDVPNFKAIPVDVLHEILLQGSRYKILEIDGLLQTQSNYIDDLRSLYLDPKSGNTKLVLDTNGKYTLRIHRSIIAARCPKLRDILNDHFTRSNDIMVFVNKYLYDDTMVQAFPDFIEFLYTGEISVSPKNAQPLIRIWEVMNMPLGHIVFSRCQEMGINTLNLDNVLPLYKSLLVRRENNGNESVGVLEQECKKMCLRYWRDLHVKHGETILQFFNPQIYFSLNCEYMGLKNNKF